MRVLFVCMSVICLLVPATGQADLFSNKKAFKAKTKVLDKRASAALNISVSIEPVKVSTPTKWGPTEGFDGKYNGPYLAMAKDAASRNNVPIDLFLRLVQQESGWNAEAKSHKGAIGLAQLMPGTARVLRVNPHDPYENLDGGARYLAEQYKTFGSWKLALAAYNAGPHAVQKYGGIPPYKETKNYVKVIWGS